MYDLIVIGGGPAGSAAAITAARLGARVLLLERGRFPRHKVCGEFVSAESLGLLADLLGPQPSPLLQDAIRISHGRFFAGGQTLRFTIAPAAASITRLDLDAALWNSAEKQGVEAQQQIAVEKILGTGPFRVVTSKGTYEARALINASGRWSNLSAPPPKTQEKWIGLKAHFSESQPAQSVDLYFFEGGYCGMQPVRSLADKEESLVDVCTMVRADVASSFPEVFNLHPGLLERSKRWQPFSKPVSTSPLVFQTPTPIRDGILLAGDAAGFVDPFVGDGISMALRGGALAAECLTPFLRGNVAYAEALRQYAGAYEKSFSTVFRTSARIRWGLQLPGWVRKPVLFFLEKNPSLAQYLMEQTR